MELTPCSTVWNGNRKIGGIWKDDDVAGRYAQERGIKIAPELREYDHSSSADETPENHAPHEARCPSRKQIRSCCVRVHDIRAAHQAQQNTEKPFAQQASAGCEVHMKDGSAAETKPDRLSYGAEIDEELTQTAAPIRRIGFGISRVTGEGRNMQRFDVGGEVRADELDDSSDPAGHARSRTKANDCDWFGHG